MKIQTRFLKLYEKVKEGWWPDALISYREFPFDQIYLSNPGILKYRYTHEIVLNLWIAHMKISWVDKEYAPPKE